MSIVICVCAIYPRKYTYMLGVIIVSNGILLIREYLITMAVIIYVAVIIHECNAK